MTYTTTMWFIVCIVTLLLCFDIGSADEPKVGKYVQVPVCKNKFSAKCKLWESQGECESSRDYMLTVCPLACGVCLPTSQVTGCEDQHRNCRGWGSRGECNKRPSYMNTVCPKTCNACPPTEPSECVDQHSLCFVGAMLGECTSNPSFYRTFCAHSCRSAMPDVCAQEKSAVKEVCAHQFDCGLKNNIHSNRTRRSKIYEDEISSPPSLKNRDEYARRIEVATAVLKELGEDESTIENAMKELEDFHLLPRNSRILEDMGINQDMSNQMVAASSVREKAEVVRSFMNKDISQSAREGRFLDSFSIEPNFCRTDAATGSLLVDLGLNWCAAAAALLLLVGPAAVAVHQNIQQEKAAKNKAPLRLPLNEINHPYGSHFGVYPAPPETAPVETYKYVAPVTAPVETYKYVAPVTAPVVTYKYVAPVTAPAETYKYVAPVSAPVESIKAYVPETAPVEALKTIEATSVSEVTINEEPDLTLDIDVRGLNPEKNVATSSTDEESSVIESSDEPIKREITYHPSIKALVPFCTIQGYLDLVKRLKPLVGHNTGLPLTPLAASIALAINYCQYGTGSPDVLNTVPLAPEVFEMQPAFSILTDDLQTAQPPKRWPGLSFPSLHEFQGSVSTPKPTTEAMPLVLMLLFNNSVVATNDTNMDGIIVDVSDEDIAEALEKDLLSKPQPDSLNSETNGENSVSNKDLSKPERIIALDDTSTDISDIVKKVTDFYLKNANASEVNLSEIVNDIKLSNISEVKISLEGNTGTATNKKESDKSKKVENDKNNHSGTGIGTGAFIIDGTDYKKEILEDINLHMGDFAVDDMSAFGGFGNRRTARRRTFKKASPYRPTQSYGPAFDYGSQYGSWQSSYNLAEDRVDAEIVDQSTNDGTLTSSSFACGGAPITPFHILTAAHCVTSDGSVPKVLRLGEAGPDRLGEDIAIDYDVQDVTVHPGYKLPERYNDLAIITLKQKMEFSAPVHPYCVPNEPYANQDHLFTISGWGTVHQGLSEILANVNVSLISESDCSSSYMLKGDHNPAFTTQYPQGISQKLVCAAYNGDAICRGDSGGPLIESAPSGLQQVFGIASATGGSCTEYQHPIIYTRVQQYYDWINDVIYGGCDEM